MSAGNEKNCRLCLKILGNDYNVIIQEITREICEILLLKIDLSVSEEPLLCKSCMESVQEASHFKSTCIAVDKQIVSLAIDRNSAELDIRDIYLKENEKKGFAFYEGYNICRFCLQCLEKSNCNLLNDLRKSLTDEMLHNCIPELDLNITKEPVICATCLKSLETYYSLSLKCRNTEKNITKYCELQGADCNGQIILSNVLKFLFKNKLDCSKGKYDNDVDTYSDINNVWKIKEEKVIIKDENAYDDYNTEEKNCDETKQNEIVMYDVLTHQDFSGKHILVYKDVPKVTVYKCNLCNYETTWKNSLRDHMLTHKDSSYVVTYRCERCTFETKYKDHLKTHMIIHKGNSEVIIYKCKLCSYETKLKNYIKNHMLIHEESSDTVMYKCEWCLFETKRKSYLNRHMLIHKDNSEVIMYKCNICSYESKRKDKLRRHMLTHKDSSDVVMYKCERCTFETKRKDYLKKHTLVHKDN